MSRLCAVAQSPEMLIATRALQGGFGALLIPQGFGMLKECFPESEMPKVFGAFGPVMGLSANRRADRRGRAHRCPLGVAVLGTVFFSDVTGGHAWTDSLGHAAWLCLIPLAIACALIFRLPMRAREQPGGH